MELRFVHSRGEELSCEQLWTCLLEAVAWTHTALDAAVNSHRISQSDCKIGFCELVADGNFSWGAESNQRQSWGKVRDEQRRIKCVGVSQYAPDATFDILELRKRVSVCDWSVNE